MSVDWLYSSINWRSIECVDNKLHVSVEGGNGCGVEKIGMSARDDDRMIFGVKTVPGFSQRIGSIGEHEGDADGDGNGEGEGGNFCEEEFDLSPITSLISNGGDAEDEECGRGKGFIFSLDTFITSSWFLRGEEEERGGGDDDFEFFTCFSFTLTSCLRRDEVKGGGECEPNFFPSAITSSVFLQDGDDGGGDSESNPCGEGEGVISSD